MKKSMMANTMMLISLLLILCATDVVAQESSHSASDSRPQLKIGDFAPTFTLQDQHDKRVSLDDFRGKQVILICCVFSFSPEANHDLRALKEEGAKLKKIDQILVISVDSVAVNHAFADTLGFPFLLLS